jgi:hypothetical protein
MGRSLKQCGVAAAIILGALGFMQVSASAAQNGAANGKADAKATPRLANGKPDFTGYFRSSVAGAGQAGEQVLTKAPDGSAFYAYGGATIGAEASAQDSVARDKNPAPYKPEYKAKADELLKYAYGPRDNKMDPSLYCKPNGVVRSPIDNNMQITHHVNAVSVLLEQVPGSFMRIIYTDGRKHPENVDTSFYGHSIGHWEGDTLVVDTVGLNDETWLGGIYAKSIHSDQLHVVERWTRTGDSIEVQMTVEDPVMFTKPWVLPARTTKLGPAEDYFMAIPCVDVTSEHQIVNTPEDTFRCNWCNSESVYGGAEDKLSAPVRTRGGGGE